MVEPGPLLEACRDAKILFLCSPNNPTGNATPVDIVADIVDNTGCMVFLDNAYIEFSGIDYLPLMEGRDNLILGRTFSKAYFACRSASRVCLCSGMVPAILPPGSHTPHIKRGFCRYGRRRTC